MKIKLLNIALYLCFVATNVIAQKSSSINVENITTHFEQKIPAMMKQADVPGLSIAVNQNSEIVWSQGFGITDHNLKKEVTANTIFEAGSLSKPVFAYAVLKLVDQGLLNLDSSLSLYLPVKYILDNQIDKITARMVLSHTSGLPLWWPEGENLSIHFTPGEKFSYSSEGFVYLQNVVETITSEPLQVFMKKQVFDPLEMKNSSYVWEERFEKQAAMGHNQFGQEETLWMRNKGNAASSLLTTANDYAKFIIAVLNGTGLKDKIVSDMLKPQVYLDPDCIDCTDHMAAELSKYLAWGLGWGLQLSNNETTFWHWGDNLVFTSYCVASKKNKTGIVYFTNSSNGLMLRNEIVTQVIGGKHPAFDWVHYDQYDSPGVIFRQTVLKEGTEKGLAKYFELKQSGNYQEFISETAINEIGYILMNTNRVPEAIEIFRLNVKEHPNSWNVYDSLAEAYAAQGDKTQAVNYYNIALKKADQQDQKQRILQTIKKLNN
jgi:CubicO group peptidase (beta-lactamase class C family)